MCNLMGIFALLLVWPDSTVIMLSHSCCSERKAWFACGSTAYRGAEECPVPCVCETLSKCSVVGDF